MAEAAPVQKECPGYITLSRLAKMSIAGNAARIL